VVVSDFIHSAYETVSESTPPQYSAVAACAIIRKSSLSHPPPTLLHPPLTLSLSWNPCYPWYPSLFLSLSLSFSYAPAFSTVWYTRYFRRELVVVRNKLRGNRVYIITIIIITVGTANGCFVGFDRLTCMHDSNGNCSR